MRRRRATTDSASVSLFPFLAVLICTMGSLILLLVVIARQARLQANQIVAVAQTASADLAQVWDALQERLGVLQTLRNETADELARRRSLLGQLEAQNRQLQDELAELQRTRALLEQKLDGAPTAEVQAELKRMTARIADLKARLAAARRAAHSQSPSYAIVPYEGPNETRRRPIYIECRRDRIVLQPEGVALTERDFDGPLDNSNALASAVRAAEQYLGRNRASNLREAGEPYPLLLVRPDGVNSYYVARAALRSWGSDFGYELIDEDWQLDFKQPDAALASVEAKAVEDARQRQVFLGYAGTGIGGGGGGGGSFSSAANATSGSIAPHDDEAAHGSRFRVTADGRLVRESGSSRSPKLRTGGGRLGRYAEITGESAGGAGEMASPAGQPPSNAANGSKTNSAGELASKTDAADGSLGANGIPESVPAPASTALTTGTPGAQVANTPRMPAGAQASEASDAQGGPSFPSPASSSPSAASSGSAMGAPASDAAIASDKQGPQILPQKLFGQNHAREGGTNSLAESQGKNWALPDSSRGSIPVTRPINVECREDRIVVLPEVPGGPGRRELPFAGQTTNAVTGLITAIWDRMDGWGIAGKGMYWRPELHVIVVPGGERRVAELKTLLADSGVVIVDRPTAITARRY